MGKVYSLKRYKNSAMAKFYKEFRKKSPDLFLLEKYGEMFMRVNRKISSKKERKKGMKQYSRIQRLINKKYFLIFDTVGYAQTERLQGVRLERFL